MIKLKTFFRWFIISSTFFFIVKTLNKHWQELESIRLNNQSWLLLTLALWLTILAHVWSGFVWTWIFKAFKQPIDTFWAINLYLTTNIAKYIPGNIGHFYARITAIHKIGLSLSLASLIVLLEPILMAASASILVIITRILGIVETKFSWQYFSYLTFFLIITFIVIHPKIINRLLQILSKIKKTSTAADSKNETEKKSPQIEQYLLLPLLGEIGFLCLRSLGFLLSLIALTSINFKQIPLLLGTFNFAWLLGLIIPGAPGGLGVFEATAIAFLQHQFPPAIILSQVALFRIISILAEVITCGFAYLKLNKSSVYR